MNTLKKTLRVEYRKTIDPLYNKVLKLHQYILLLTGFMFAIIIIGIGFINPADFQLLIMYFIAILINGIVLFESFGFLFADALLEENYIENKVKES